MNDSCQGSFLHFSQILGQTEIWAEAKISSLLLSLLFVSTHSYLRKRSEWGLCHCHCLIDNKNTSYLIQGFRCTFFIWLTFSPKLKGELGPLFFIFVKWQFSFKNWRTSRPLICWQPLKYFLGLTLLECRHQWLLSLWYAREKFTHIQLFISRGWKVVWCTRETEIRIWFECMWSICNLIIQWSKLVSRAKCYKWNSFLSSDVLIFSDWWVSVSKSDKKWKLIEILMCN